MEPILVSFNKMQYESDVARLANACKMLTGKLAQIEEISAIKLTPEMVTELLYANEPIITETAVIKSISDSLEAAGLRIKSIRNAAELDARNSFYTAFNALVNSRNVFYDANLSRSLEWNGEALEIRESYLEELRERHSSFIKTEAGSVVREAQLKFFAAAQEFFEVLPQQSKGLVSQAFGMHRDRSGLYMNDWEYDFMTSGKFN